MVTIWLKAPRTAAINMHTHVYRTWITCIHSYAYINTVTTLCCEAPVQLLQNLDSNFILKVPEGGGANRSARRKPLNACPLIGITY